ncbi:MAG: SanA/YdcF family protein [Bellilinea sp.]
MLRRIIRYAWRTLLSLTAIAVLALGLPTATAVLLSNAHTYTLEEAPAAQVAIVFGAGLNRDGSPGAVLRDRVSTAADLYFDGKVQKLLMSGDNRFLDYNEPGAMQGYAIELGVPEADIVLDYAGRRTYDTCYRAQHIFDIQQALLVTQAYHLPRALITCRSLGLDAKGIVADQREYNPVSFTRWVIREVPATTVAFWDLYIARPLPVLGLPEPIFPTNATVQP